MRSLLDTERLVVYGDRSKDGHRKRVGRVVEVVFAPDEPRVVGLLIERRNILFLFRRKEVILALDRARVLSDRVEVDGDKAWGKQAAKRLGVDWDKAVIWKGMPVKTESGVRLRAPLSWHARSSHRQPLDRRAGALDRHRARAPAHSAAGP